MRGDAEITNREDVIDSREIIDRIDYLEDERTALSDKLDEAQEAFNEYNPPEDEWDSNKADELKTTIKDAQEALTEWDESDEGQELKSLTALQDDAEGYSEDWKHGSTLVRDTYFQDYTEELASEISDYNPNKVSWPMNCIDWEKAADELKQDYTCVDFDGVEYWTR